MPYVLTAGALNGFSGHLFGQLPFADGARFGHHVRHDLAPLVSPKGGCPTTKHVTNQKFPWIGMLESTSISCHYEVDTVGSVGRYRISRNADLLGMVAEFSS